MNFKTRNDGASAAAGQAQPLPVPREGEGRAAPLPTPREGDGRATPLPVAPRVDDAPDEGDAPSPESDETHSITKPALDYYYDRAKGHFARFNNMSVAFKLAGRDLKTRIVKNGRVFDLKPRTAFENFLESHALRTRDGAPQETPDVAARRRDWDEAKRAGDAGAMTTTANALMRAVEEARGHLGAHKTARAEGEDGARHPTSEVLNPGVSAKSVNELAADIHERGLVKGSPAKWADAEHIRPYLTPKGDIVPGGDAVPPKSNDDMPPRGTAQAHDEADDRQASLTPDQTEIAANAIMSAPEYRRSETLRELQERFGNKVIAQLYGQLRSPPSMAVEGDEEPGSTTPGAVQHRDLPEDSKGRDLPHQRGNTVELQSGGGSIPAGAGRVDNELRDPPVKRPCDHDFCVPRDWRLAKKTARGGWIVQQVKVETTWWDENGRMRSDVAYFYEAWYVPANSDRPVEQMRIGTPPYPNDSIGFNGRAGTKGDVTFTVSARFYEGLSLDMDLFKRNPRHPYAGRLLATAPTKRPQNVPFRNTTGQPVGSSAPVDRVFRHSWGWGPR